MMLTGVVPPGLCWDPWTLRPAGKKRRTGATRVHTGEGGNSVVCVPLLVVVDLFVSSSREKLDHLDLLESLARRD